jgi:hypothetical protein
MELESLPTEIILSHNHELIAKINLDWIPQPGNHLELEGKNYTVLERHHHYQYKIGGYCLRKISLVVQKSEKPSEKSLFEGRWILGDARCRFNAHSELLRCAVNPLGSCEGCRYFEILK